MKKYNITVNGTTYEVVVEEVDASASAPVYTQNTTYTPAPASKAPVKTPAASASGTSVTAPMPGTILAVKVTAGQTVKKGDVICVLEAMKMENDIPAPEDGVIGSINIQKGASVNAGDVLATIN